MSSRTKMNEDINQEILSELRRMRRSSEVAVYFAIVFVVAGVGYVAWLRHERERSSQAYYQSRSSAQTSAWQGTESALDRGDNAKALSIAQSFAARQPAYHYAHACLGSVYVAMGDFTNAEAAYARAVELYPDENHKKALAAIRKGLAGQRATQSPSKSE